MVAVAAIADKQASARANHYHFVFHIFDLFFCQRVAAALHAHRIFVSAP
jgi:hypothetical protein